EEDERRGGRKSISCQDCCSLDWRGVLLPGQPAIRIWSSERNCFRGFDVPAHLGSTNTLCLRSHSHTPAHTHAHTCTQVLLCCSCVQCYCLHSSRPLRMKQSIHSSCSLMIH